MRKRRKRSVNDGFIDRFIDVVHVAHVPDPCKAFLLYLARYYMTDKGSVSVPREQLARELGVSARTVSSRFQAAVGAGLLRRTRSAKPGTTQAFVAQVNIPGSRNHENGCSFWQPYGCCDSATSSTPKPEDTADNGGKISPNNAPTRSFNASSPDDRAEALVFHRTGSDDSVRVRFADIRTTA